eukprot:gnl/TRDRNA2_/TRDRNA2_156351_c1_seq1.p1 gnl/TRDRNA2_/TRDRNA2_156351_c1~~gnl/TRDRNA2_/TRDRNA2_156351_c1_seq1.p1  ORF type:complete len:206 (+),score=37.78 gnl/TRDRNA2_/TRDRNA2_156351_c1_seq1:71-619(+)
MRGQARAKDLLKVRALVIKLSRRLALLRGDAPEDHHARFSLGKKLSRLYSLVEGLSSKIENVELRYEKLRHLAPPVRAVVVSQPSVPKWRQHQQPTQKEALHKGLPLSGESSLPDDHSDVSRLSCAHEAHSRAARVDEDLDDQEWESELPEFPSRVRGGHRPNEGKAGALGQCCVPQGSLLD